MLPVVSAPALPLPTTVLDSVRRCEISDAGQRSRPNGPKGQLFQMGLLGMCQRSLRVLFEKKKMG